MQYSCSFLLFLQLEPLECCQLYYSNNSSDIKLYKLSSLSEIFSRSPQRTRVSSFSSRAQLSRPNACSTWGLRPTASTKHGVLVAFIVVLTRDGEHSPRSRWYQTFSAENYVQAALPPNAVQLPRLNSRVRWLKGEQTRTSGTISFLSRTHLVLETSNYSSFSNLLRQVSRDSLIRLNNGQNFPEFCIRPFHVASSCLYAYTCHHWAFSNSSKGKTLWTATRQLIQFNAIHFVASKFYIVSPMWR